MLADQVQTQIKPCVRPAGTEQAAIFADQLFNLQIDLREALAELRVNAAQDLGDDRGETVVGFLANPGYTQQVRGAKVGRTALQIGAGLSVPVGTQGTIFVNGNADIDVVDAAIRAVLAK